MAYRLVEHGGELAVELSAESEAELYEAALELFRDLVASDEHGEPVEHELVLSDADRGLLLVDWLNELVFLADAEGFEPKRLVELQLEGNRVRGRVAGSRGRPRQLVKAATLHDLELEAHQGGGFSAHLVLDV